MATTPTNGFALSWRGTRMRVLVLAPHTDDAEFGCGGTIARLVAEGHEVHCAAFSSCEESIPAGFPKDALAREMFEAAAVLGVPRERVRLFEYRVRRFSERRQDILEELVRLARELKPDLVLMPSLQDTHQDHQVIAQEAPRAFKQTTILSYDMPWNTPAFTTQVFVELRPEHLQRKLAAIRRYHSQRHRPYAKPAFLRGLASTRGVPAGLERAEAFEIIRWVVPASAARPSRADAARTARRAATTWT